VRLRWLLAACAFAAPVSSQVPGQGQSAREHVPPDPPQYRVHQMPYREMAAMMGMDDRRRFGKVMLDRLEWQDADAGSVFAWDAAAWYGGDFNKLWLEAEGERAAGTTHDARFEIAWDRIVSRWWSMRVGARQDSGIGPARSWAAFGVAGLAPGFVDIEAKVYVGEQGRTAARLAAEYDLLLTQRLVLQPEIELNLYGKDDPERLIGAGLSNMEMGLRLRYEIRRELAPYFGVSWSRSFGHSADFVRAAGEDPDEITLVAGIRAWF
jgi:copper resistance protein B